MTDLEGAASVPTIAVSYRGDFVENRYGGWWALTQASSTSPACQVIQASSGAEQVAIFGRSSAKPFQALPILMSPIAQELLQEAQILSMASHSGTPEHQAVVQRVLEQAGLHASNLICGTHAPLDKETATALRAQGAEANVLHHNCSGQHAVMAWFCKQQGWPVEHYHQPEHPLQQMLFQYLAEWCKVSEFPRWLNEKEHSTDLSQESHGIPYATDGCQLPAYYLPLSTWAGLFAQLTVRSEAKAFVTMVQSSPTMIAGPGRLDSLLIERTRDSKEPLFCKSGADGVVGVSNLARHQGLMIKVADGNLAVRDAFLLSKLRELGWLTSDTQTYLRNAVLKYAYLKPGTKPGTESVFFSIDVPNSSSRRAG